MSRAVVLIFECGLYGTLFCLIARFLSAVFFLIFMIIDDGMTDIGTHRCRVNFKEVLNEHRVVDCEKYLSVKFV